MSKVQKIDLDDTYFWSNTTGEPLAQRMTIRCCGCNRILAPFTSKKGLSCTGMYKRWVGLEYKEHVAIYTISCHRCGEITEFEVTSE